MTNAISSLAAGWRTTCGVFNDQLQCFGWNQYGQVGVGPNGNQFLPVPVDLSADGILKADQLSLGVVHSCAIAKQSKELYCWGSNDSIDLLLDRPASYYTPQLISLKSGVFQNNTGTEVLQIASGRTHNCAVVSYSSDVQNRRFLCWGSNQYGQLGISSGDLYSDPIEVALKILPQQISAGYSHQCAVQAADNSLWCWGLNLNGQIGVGTNANVYVPTKIPQVGAVTSISAGSYHTCVISMMDAELDDREGEDGREEGNVYCFGVNDFGQLGIGNKEDQQLPQKVDLDGPAKEIKAGRDHTCALMENGTIKCWGSNLVGQLGIGTNQELSTTPLTVVGLSGAEKLVSGREHGCASIQSDQTLWCWGSNSHGQLGLGEGFANQNRPQKVAINFPLNGYSPPPTGFSTEPPSKNPVMMPTTLNPAKSPAPRPLTNQPTRSPTKLPTEPPTKSPTKSPTKAPTMLPTKQPTETPTPPPTKPLVVPPTSSPTKALPILIPTSPGAPNTTQPTIEFTQTPTSLKPTPIRGVLLDFPTAAPSILFETQDDTRPSEGSSSVIIIVPTADDEGDEETNLIDDSSNATNLESIRTRRSLLLTATCCLLYFLGV